MNKKIEQAIHIYPAFYQKVWRIVATIPTGETRSYTWVAQQLGKPRAYRAVGNALNKNPFPVVIPCHRVIRADKTIGGFSRGVTQKRMLLHSEGVHNV